MKNSAKYILLIFTMFIIEMPTLGLEIIYPKTNPVSINSKSTFFIGNVDTESRLEINAQEVKVWDNGSFASTVPLLEGENHFILKEITKNNKENEINFVINTSTLKTQAEPNKCPDIQTFNPNYLKLITTKKNIPLRQNDNNNSTRLTHLNEDIPLFAIEKRNDYYKIMLSNNSYAWINELYVRPEEIVNNVNLSTINKIEFCNNKNFNTIEFNLSEKKPYMIKETPIGLELQIWQTQLGNSTITDKTILIKQEENITKTEISISKLWGYDCFYEGNKLILKIRKSPEINIDYPLKDITIAIDPGHGGADAGAIGPTGVKEKEINLDIAKKLEAELILNGAKVVLTRNIDTNVDLYKRVEIAQKEDSLISISLHANALADGADPIIKHGTSVFYYNKEAKELANILKTYLINDLQTKDDGTNYASFVLTRPTAPLSVLIEVAYMIHPQEYSLLLDENFRQKTAVSIKNALCDYLKRNKNY